MEDKLKIPDEAVKEMQDFFRDQMRSYYRRQRGFSKTTQKETLIDQKPFSLGLIPFTIGLAMFCYSLHVLRWTEQERDRQTITTVLLKKLDTDIATWAKNRK